MASDFFADYYTEETKRNKGKKLLVWLVITYKEMPYICNFNIHGIINQNYTDTKLAWWELTGVN